MSRGRPDRGWLAPVALALDGRAARGGRVELFVRDDDAGWEHARLNAMVEVFAAHGAPIDLAVIPDALSVGDAADLRDWADAGTAHLHQHGFRHVDHEPADRRKCEFGPARTPAALHADVAAGRDRLATLLGGRVEPIFTPPWNRSCDALAPALLECGLRVLSRDRSAGTIGHPGLVELPVDVDWFAKRRGRGCSHAELAIALADHIATATGPVGVMLHHGVTDADELAAISELVGLLAGHPAAALRPMAALALRAGGRV